MLEWERVNFSKKNYDRAGFEPRSYKKTAEYTLRATTILPTPTHLRAPFLIYKDDIFGF